MEELDNIRLPRLPREQARWDLMQRWWQTIVEQIEAAINAQNEALAAILANEETITSLTASISALTEQSRRISQIARAALLVAQEAGDREAVLEGRINAVASENHRMRQQIEGLEVLWLH